MNKNTETILVNKPPSSFLAGSKQPPTEKILNAYDLKTSPELVRFYQTVAGLPTTPTWLAAIKNSHYAYWTGLNYSSVVNHFPESEET